MTLFIMGSFVMLVQSESNWIKYQQKEESLIN